MLLLSIKVTHIRKFNRVHRGRGVDRSSKVGRPHSAELFHSTSNHPGDSSRYLCISTMAAASSSKLAQKLSTIATSWPKDPFRPHLQLSTFFQSLSTHPKLTPQAVQATQSLKNSEVLKKVRCFSRECFHQVR